MFQYSVKGTDRREKGFLMQNAETETSFRFAKFVEINNFQS